MGVPGFYGDMALMLATGLSAMLVLPTIDPAADPAPSFAAGVTVAVVFLILSAA